VVVRFDDIGAIENYQCIKCTFIYYYKYRYLVHRW